MLCDTTNRNHTTFFAREELNTLNQLREKIHFIGIGGAGMSGLARILLELGYRVSGSDIKPTEVTEQLSDLGAEVHIGHARENVGEAGTVVVSTAIRNDNPEVTEARDRGIPIIHRADVLARIMELRKSIAVAGAHGKTTTTSMIALVMEKNRLDPTVIVGGILQNIGGNAKLGQGSYLVAEADESDGSFLKLNPYLAVVTNIEDDHMDHYGSMENIMKAFLQFVSKVPDDGLLILCADDENVKKVMRHCIKPYITYGLKPGARYTARNIENQGLATSADIYDGEKLLGRLTLNVPGRHNLSNALAAVVTGLVMGLQFSDIAKALEEFRGVQRRFQLLGEVKGVKVVDDYAHHPTELQATLKAARQTQPKRVVAVFQPHRFTRTRQLYKEFGKSFAEADVIVVSDIYAAGETPIPGVTAKLITRAIEKTEGRPVHFCPTLEQTTEYLEEITEPGDLVLTLGAGNIWTVGVELVKRLGRSEREVVNYELPGHEASIG